MEIKRPKIKSMSYEDFNDNEYIERMIAELRDGDSGWHWGSCHDPRLKEYYYAMTEAINDEQYIENSRNLQHLADEEMFGLTFAWQTGFFPYRTDKIEGWDNWQSWGVINARTWFDLTAK